MDVDQSNDALFRWSLQQSSIAAYSLCKEHVFHRWKCLLFEFSCFYDRFIVDVSHSIKLAVGLLSSVTLSI